MVNLPLLERAILTLAGQCDGARTQDGIGFNGGHTATGRALAARVGRWTPQETLWAADAVRTYPAQLARAGVDVAQIGRPEMSTVRRVDAAPEAGALLVSFPFSPQVLAGLRNVPGRKRFNGVHRVWTVSIDGLDREAFDAFCRLFDFGISPAARLALVDVAAQVRPADAPPVPVVPLNPRRVVLDGDHVDVFAPYDAELVAVCSALGGRFDRARRLWRLPVSVEVVSSIATHPVWTGFDGRDVVAGALETIAARRTAALAESSRAAGSLTFPWLRAGLAPMPFQVAGVEAIIRRGCAVLADPPGLGKTIQALLWLGITGKRGAIVVVPTSVLFNWAREAKRWLPSDWSVVMMTTGTLPTGWDRADVVLIPVSRLSAATGATKVRVTVPGRKRAKVEYKFPSTGTVLQARRWAAIVVDEAHYFKTRDAERTVCLLQLTKDIESVLPMTGTPMLNRPSEWITLLTMTRTIDAFGGAFKFLMRYCDGQKTTFGWDFSGASNLDELHLRLREHVMIRRSKAEVLTELPEKFTPRVVTLDLANRAAYRRVDSDVRAWMREHRADANGARKAEAIVRITKLRKMAAQGKLAGAVEWLTTLVESGEPVVVFARHIEIQQAIVAAFPGCAAILGEMDAETRQAQVDRFQRDAVTNVLVSSLAAGGVGWTGTRAAHVVFLELDWTPSAHEQAEDRLHRIGQTRAVTPWYLLAEDSIDDVLWDVLAAKGEGIAQAMDGKAAGAFASRGNDGGFDAVVSRLSA